MPKGRKDIYKSNTGGFQKNPQNINRSGANKKNYTRYIEELKAKGYSAPTKSEYFEMVGLFMVMNENDLKEFASDKTKAYWLRILVSDLNDKKIRSKIQSDYRDWLFGRAEQKTDFNISGEPPIIQFVKTNTDAIK